MAKLISINPSTVQKLGEVDVSTPKEVQDKVKIAHTTHKTWRAIGLTQRLVLLKSLLPIFSSRRQQLALLASEEMGMPYAQSLDDLDGGVEYFTWYLENAQRYLEPEITFEDENEIHQVVCEPKGVVAVIVPWNFPFSNFIWQVGQNLIVGNTVVFKHSEETPLFGKELEKVFTDSEVPAGVFNEVYGDGKVGQILAQQDIDMICFTGSTQTGKELYKIGAQKLVPVLMELGGSAPGLVFEDAHVDKVIESIYLNKFLNCGQICDGLKRLIVHHNKLDEVIHKLQQILKSKKVGISVDQATDVGPLVAKRQLDLLQDQVADALLQGAQTITAGGVPQGLKGYFYQPTLLVNVSTHMRIWSEEVFGPVLPIMSFQTYEQAIELANNTKYGLGGYIFTQDSHIFEKASTDIQTSMISQNNLTYAKPCNPFGGCKASGLGREHGKYGFHELTQVKLVTKEK
jgi:succinate-semialdehyde dehydrogenase/glutarate-semialdehyde dehydrogenase